jgi:hypothetical protein
VVAAGLVFRFLVIDAEPLERAEDDVDQSGLERSVSVLDAQHGAARVPRAAS